jgi:hypothetical protein
MPCIIKKWYGRTGNNIIQLINCLYYAFYINNYDKIIFPKHKLLKTIIIKNFNKKNQITQKFTHIFFYAKKLGFSLEPYEMREIAQKYLIADLNINLNKSSNKDDLYIHIRGGDSMADNVFLLQNPMKLYKTIINENKYNKIHVVYEDNQNSTINELRKIDNIQFQSSSPIKDLETLCSANNFLMCFSTFSLMVYFLSKNIKHILIPKFMMDEWYPQMKWGIKMTIYDLEDYTISQWKKMKKIYKQKFLINYNKNIVQQSVK